MSTAPAPTPLDEGSTRSGAVTCPVCGTSIDSPPIANYRSQQAANHFCPVTRSTERNAAFERTIRRLWGGPTASVYECPTCTHGFAWPHVAGDAEFYELMHANAGYPTMRWEYRAFVDALPRTPTAHAAHLDIGTGDGSFLNLLPPGYERCGTESTDVMRAQLEAKGIKTFRDVDEAIAARPEGFDSATMFQVIEHIADFQPLLAKCRQLLKPGGLIGLSVPNGAFKTTQERVTGCADMPPNHVNRWTPKSMTTALERAGFRVRESKLKPVTFDAMMQNASLKTLAVATSRPRSLSAQFYRVQNRRLRRALFSLSGAYHLLSLVPHRRAIMTPQEFLCIAENPAGSL